MGRKDTLSNWAMFGSSGVDMSVSSTTSTVTSIQYMDNIGIAVSWAGTSPVGALTIDVSNDKSTWQSLDFGSAISISGNSGNHLITINQNPFSWVRATYTKTSGVGTLSASLTSKQVGG